MRKFTGTNAKARQRGLFGGRIVIPLRIAVCLFPCLVYLLLSCWLSGFGNPLLRWLPMPAREYVDTHASTLAKLSPEAHEALSSQRPLPVLESGEDHLFAQVPGNGGAAAPSVALHPPSVLISPNASVQPSAQSSQAPEVPSSALQGEEAAGHSATTGPLKVEEMQFRVEDHGFQCLVYRHRARKVTPHLVTWVTQMTADRLKIFEEMLKRWNGPVSVALYSQDVEKDVKEIDHLLDRVDFHIVGASQGLYPVNTLRNVALNNARTDFVVLADVDFVPGYGTYEAISSFVQELQAAGRQNERKVYVFPAFEIDGDDQTVPHDFDKLKAMGGKIHQVHNDGGREIAHKYTLYDTWMQAQEPYKVSYKFPYEPYILAPRFIPRYDVRFFGYGNDKASHNYELNAAGFEFWVFPKHFMVHVRHPQGSWVQQTFMDPKDRVSRTLTTFLRDCDRRYSMRLSKQDAPTFAPLAPSAKFSAQV